MRLCTASEVISFARRLESESAGFYEELSRRYPQDSDVFLSFARENGKNVVQVERAYYGVISDAIEGCFAFDIEVDGYTPDTGLPDKAAYSDAIGRAVDIEDKLVRFYSDAAEQSKSLMADVPRTFVIVARKRSSRIPGLKSLIAKAGQ